VSDQIECDSPFSLFTSFSFAFSFVFSGDSLVEALSFLKGLSQVKRFDMNLMMLSKLQKQGKDLLTKE